MLSEGHYFSIVLDTLSALRFTNSSLDKSQELAFVFAPVCVSKEVVKALLPVVWSRWVQLLWVSIQTKETGKSVCLGKPNALG